jgi:hypothetical protein
MDRLLHAMFTAVIAAANPFSAMQASDNESTSDIDNDREWATSESYGLTCTTLPRQS